MATKPELINEIRYAERLCLRTARMYRRLQTFGTFATVVGGSATLSALAPQIPGSVSVVGSVAFVLFGAALLAIRPSEKAVANEADAKRYAAMRTTAQTMTPEDLEIAINKVRENDTAEVEALRLVAYNDVCNELGKPESAAKLSVIERLFSALA